jgi:hypothetical protein
MRPSRRPSRGKDGHDREDEARDRRGGGHVGAPQRNSSETACSCDAGRQRQEEAGHNHSYAILSVETHRVGADLGGPAAGPLLDLSSPNLNFTKIAEGMGVPATRARTCDELAEQLRHALTEPGPHLIDAIVPGVI